MSLDDERIGAAIGPSGPDRQFSDLELRDRLEKAIARLPDNQRLLIAAHYLQGVQYEDLAEAFRLPLGHGEDTAASGEAAAATVARDGPQMNSEP